MINAAEIEPQELTEDEVGQYAGNFYDRLATMHVTVESAQAVAEALVDLVAQREAETGVQGATKRSLSRSRAELASIRDRKLSELLDQVHDLRDFRIISADEAGVIELDLREAFCRQGDA